MSASFKTCYGYQTTRCNYDNINAGTKNLPHFAQSSFLDNPGSIDDEIHQWLTDGYYFWLNSDRYAEWWGKYILKSDYLITKYEISLERDDVLDLIENPDDEDYFFWLVETYLEKYNQSIGVPGAEHLPVPTVSSILHFFRKTEPEIFPFLAVTITDFWTAEPVFQYLQKHKYLKMSPTSTSQHDKYRAMGRPQICVFEEVKNCITNSTPIYPGEYVDSFSE
ncbi:hypothetical protein [Acinetobacter courvalinii]|uniref:hypothetical protein n=1 Tax=Acinetobacter courvalinii TaxID=280147 RepID=UPI00190057AF|nr:hypothetical protein [Acinetobacter courvalinii]MBJ9958410.1 hypothetical protein [Acinetobacter courvalinii]